MPCESRLSGDTADSQCSIAKSMKQIHAIDGFSDVPVSKRKRPRERDVCVCRSFMKIATEVAEVTHSGRFFHRNAAKQSKALTITKRRRDEYREIASRYFYNSRIEKIPFLCHSIELYPN